MTIPAVGSLIEDEIEEGLRSAPVPIPLLENQRIPFLFVGLDEADQGEVNQAVSAFLTLGNDARSSAAAAIYNNFLELREACGYEDMRCKVESETRVWEKVEPSSIDVFRRGEDGIVYVQLMAECGWEPEHGLQLLFREGKELVRVSDQAEGLAWRD